MTVVISIVLDDFIGETEQEQRDRLEARLKRCKQLKAEREAQGLAADDTTINAIVEEEEAEVMRQKRRVRKQSFRYGLYGQVVFI